MSGFWVDNQAMPEPLWTVKDVADYLGVHAKTIYLWTHESDGPPAVRLGKYLRYRPDDVIAWVEARRQEPLEAS